MKKAVIYARFSSSSQTEQSIEGQLTVCKKFARENDFLILNEYIDRATTGTNDNRPAFQAMLRDSAKEEWNYVLVYKSDRFSRNRIETAIHKKNLRDHGIKLISATENIPDSPEGIILESLIEGMNEYYSAELSQKVKRGIAESKKKKQLTGGHVLYGYDAVDKKPKINENEASVVNRVHLLYLEGKSGRDIANLLAQQGIRDKNNNPFDLQDIYRMLRQQKYAEDDIYPPIVSKEIKERVNAITEENKRAPSRRKGYANYLLSGKLVCGECGGLMTGEAGTSKTGAIYHYYKCFEKKKHRGNCTMPSVRKNDIENLVFDICIEVLKGDFIPKIIEKAYKISEEDLQSNAAIINLETLLREKEKAINNMLAAIEQGIITPTTKERLITLEAEAEKLKYDLLTEKEKATQTVTKDDYKAFLSDFMHRQTDNASFKNDVFNLLIKQIVVFRDKICITFNYSPNRSSGNKHRTLLIDTAILSDVQSDHASTPEAKKSSNLFTSAPPKIRNVHSGIPYLSFWRR